MEISSDSLWQIHCASFLFFWSSFEAMLQVHRVLCHVSEPFLASSRIYCTPEKVTMVLLWLGKSCLDRAVTAFVNCNDWEQGERIVLWLIWSLGFLPVNVMPYIPPDHAEWQWIAVSRMNICLLSSTVGLGLHAEACFEVHRSKLVL